MTLSQGTVVAGRYRIVRLLGEGGFGAVYMAEDTRLGGKIVAVKESFNRSQEAQEQFRLEAQLLANLNHIGLPRVSDHFIEADGRQFLVMDYIQGDDLDQRVISTGRGLPENEAIAIMVQVCEAVEYLHNCRPQPIIHRDIKPPNIKITRDGRAVLVDFGIAKLYHPSKSTVKVAKAVTPHFSSPEQYVGKTDARSDVYSLGATLYCLICAAVPPDAMDRLTQNVPVPCPSRVNANISPSLEQIVLKAIDLEPNRRFQDAGQLATALRSLLKGQPVAVAVAVQGVTCPRCGRLNRSGARFCAQDGMPLTGLAPAGRALHAEAQAPDMEMGSPEMLFEIANAYARNDQFSQAIPRYERCLQLGFFDQAVYHNLGVCFLLTDQPKQAASILQQGAGRYPRDADIQYQLARAYANLDMLDKAVAAAASACQLSPKEAAHYWLYGLLLLDEKRYAEAALQFERCIQLDPNNPAGYVKLIVAYGELNDLQRAAKAFQQAANNFPTDPEPHFWIGLYYARGGKNREAIHALEAAIRLKPDLEAAHYLLGELWLDMDKTDRALPCFQKAVALDPNDADYLAKLALCYALLNRRTEAGKSARQALAINPNHKLAIEIIRRI